MNLSLNQMVGVKGFEPPTSCSQSRRATNCATPRYALVRRAETPQDLFSVIRKAEYACQALLRSVTYYT